MNHYIRYTVFRWLLFLVTCIAGAADADRDPLDVSFAFMPEHVDPARFFFVTVTVSVPRESIDIRLLVTDRTFEGFRIAGSYDRRQELAEGGYRLQRSFRLQPQPGSSRFRMAPLALEWQDNASETVAAFGYQLVPAMVFERREYRHDETAVIGGMQRLPILYERSPWPIVITVAGLIMLAAVIIAIQRRRPGTTVSPTPREQARTELDALLERHLPEHELWTDFYVELTLIIRRFIERTGNIPASEQTTSELFKTIRNDSRFSPAWIESVSDFFNHADRIKYAGDQPDIESAHRAVSAARKCIETLEPKASDHAATC